MYLKIGLINSILCLQVQSEENVSAEKIECDRWPYTDVDEECQQKFGA